MRNILIAIIIFIVFILGGVYFLLQVSQIAEPEIVPLIPSDSEIKTKEPKKVDVITKIETPYDSIDLVKNNKPQNAKTSHSEKDDIEIQKENSTPIKIEEKKADNENLPVPIIAVDPIEKTIEKVSTPKNEKIKIKFILQKNAEENQELIVEIPFQPQIGSTGIINYQTTLDKEKLLFNWDVNNWFFEGTLQGSGFLIRNQQLVISQVALIPELIQILLKPCYTLELTFIKPEGTILSEGKVISIEGDSLKNIIDNQSEKMIRNDKLLLHFRNSKLISINSIVFDKYFSDSFACDFQNNYLCKKSVSLKELIKTTIIIRDFQGRLLVDYYVYPTTSTYFEKNFDELRARFVRKEEIHEHLNLPVYKTNNQGQIEFDRHRSGEFSFFVFGENYYGRIFHTSFAKEETQKIIDVNANNNKIKFTLYDGDAIIDKEVKITVLRDNFDTVYYNMNNGDINLWGVSAGTYYMNFFVDSYAQKLVVMEVPNTSNLEFKVQLKPEGVLKGQLVLKKTGEKLKANIWIFISANKKGFEDFSMLTDNNGFFELRKLDIDLVYNVQIDSLAYIISNNFKNEIRAQDEILAIPLLEPNVLLLNIISLNSIKYARIDVSFYKPGTNKLLSFAKRTEIGYGQVKLEIKELVDVDMIISVPGFAKYKKKFTKVELQNIESPFKIELENGFDVTFKILNSTKIPLNVAKISTSATPYDGQDCIVAMTNEEGLVKIPNCTIGDRYFILHTEHPPINIVIEEKNKIELQEITMPLSFRTDGVLKNQKGEALNDIRIICTHRDTRRSLYTITDSSGKFYLTTMTSGRWTFQFEILNTEGKKTWHDVYIKDTNEQFEQVITVKEK